MICRIARDLAEACALAMRDKDNRIPKGTGPSSAMHAIDGLRYACAFICMKDRAFRDIRRLVIDKRASFRAGSEKPVQELGGGYIRIHPDALYRGKKL
jgi:zona occludens toxin (predicted ATPase)